MYHPFVTHLSQELSACLPETDHHAAADTSRTSRSLVRRCRGGRTCHPVCTDVAPTHVHKSPHAHVGRERTYMHSETLSLSCDYISSLSQCHFSLFCSCFLFISLSYFAEFLGLSFLCSFVLFVVSLLYFSFAFFSVFFKNFSNLWIQKKREESEQELM